MSRAVHGGLEGTFVLVRRGDPRTSGLVNRLT